MKQPKPLSVVWFDRLYWLSFVIFYAGEAIKFTGLSNPGARWWLMGAVPLIGIGYAIWYFASVQRGYIALMAIAILIVGRIHSFSTIYALPDLLWENPTLSFLKIAPTLLLALALGLMMTPNAAAWRRGETDYPIKIFE